MPKRESVHTICLLYLLGTFLGLVVSGFRFGVTAATGRNLSGKLLIFGGLLRGTTGCCGDQSRGTGELGRCAGAGVRLCKRTRPAEAQDLGVDRERVSGEDCPK